MAPPKFSDLGKKANGVFKDDYVLGVKQLKISSKALNGASFKVDTSRADNGSVSASFETKYNFKGVDIKEKWSSNNNVLTEIAVSNQGIKNTKFTLESNFQPGNGLGPITAKADYWCDNMYFDAMINNKQTASFNGVYGVKNFLLGASVGLSAEHTVSSTSVAASLVEKDFIATTSVANADVISGSLFHFRKGVEGAVALSYKTSSGESTFKVGAKYALDESSFVKAQINLKDLNVGASFVQKLRDGVTLTLSALVNANDFGSKANMLGVGVSFE